jgi:cell division control protein 45
MQNINSKIILLLTQRILTSDYLSYKVIPVTGFDDVSRANEDIISGNMEIYSIVFINCGAMIDLSEILSLEQHHTVYVIDSHRPLNLDNLFVNKQVFVLDDGDADNLKVEQAAYKALLESNFDDYDDDDDEVVDKEMIVNDKIIADYYKKSWKGQAASSILYQLSTQLNKSDNLMLWFGIVGLTDQFLMNSIDMEAYMFHIDLYKDEAKKFNIKTCDRDSFEPISMSSDDYSIVYKAKEFNFMLFRHWTLLESLMHSNYIASRLGLWREKGKKSLQNLLAKIG